MRRFAERHFEIVDFTVVALLWSAAFVIGHGFDHDAMILEVLKGNRVAVYAALGGLFGTIFGFAITAISIILAFAQSPKLLILRRSRYWKTLWAIFTRGIWTLMGVAMVAIVALTFDKDSRPKVLITYGLLLAVFVGVAKLCRIIWAFQKLVFIVTQPDPHEGAWEQELATLEGSSRLH